MNVDRFIDRSSPRAGLQPQMEKKTGVTAQRGQFVVICAGGVGLLMHPGFPRRIPPPAAFAQRSRPPALTINPATGRDRALSPKASKATHRAGIRRPRPNIRHFLRI